MSNSLSTDTAQVNTDAISSSTTGFPTNISVEAGDGQVTVHWNSTSQHLAYFVQVSLDGGDTWNTDGVSLSKHPISYTFTLLNDFSYHLRVVESLTLIDGVMAPAGQISNTVVVTPRASVAPQAPGKPTNLLASRSNGFATVSWSNPSDTQSIITSYEIQCSEFTFTEGDGGLWFFTNQLPYSTSAAIVPASYPSLQLRDGVTYLLNIRLGNSSGWGSYSDKVLITPNATEITAPTAPRNLQAIAGNGEVALSWDAPLSNGGAAISQYEIAYRANSDTDW
ncbi:MAG: fibronectin type III domain-containing protein, partial [Pirellulales bacterium]